MIAAVEEGGIIDEDEDMAEVKNDGEEDMENMQTMNDNSMMDEDEINEECYEDWLAKELLAMDVDGGTCEFQYFK